ncbi:hydrogenase maturation protease [Desulfothermobacter acidiphilus]|uniref:hydrogenase maturation protease n=1 Tax=Desulfothermobacter acidiphilus TaxID=1938353 RepID=UPI003F8B971A
MRAKARLIIVGCGHPYGGDDAAGLEVVRRLQEEGLPPGVEAVACGTAGLGILDFLYEAERGILVDAMVADLPPGSVLRLTEADLPEGARRLSAHDVTVREALAWGRRVGVPMPQELVIIGIVAKELGLWRETLSPEVAAGVEQALALIRQEIERFLQKTGQVP